MTDLMRDQLRKLPGVDKLLRTSEVEAAAQAFGHELTVDTIRGLLDEVRAAIASGEECPSLPELTARVLDLVTERGQSSLQPVVNASGVILHTNLGRAPLSESTLAAMQEAGRSYSNLEYDLEVGKRGSRYVHAEKLLCRLTGAEGAVVVNNNAGAVLLVLSALARGREVIISRGHLVEIGGGFRIPEVMAQSGARLVEVGTTNRTYVRDYERALTDSTAMLMRVHTSNFRVTGFTHSASLDEMAELSRERGVLLMEDLGSGTLLDTSVFGLAHEPTVQESLAEGADLVTFSGDKLLGGPQAGVIVGKQDLIARLKEFPLTRALRVDKTTIAGLQATLLHYVKGEALQKVPVWRMVSMAASEIKGRAEALADRLSEEGWKTKVVAGRSAVGGGSLPGQTLPTWVVALECASPDTVSRELRHAAPPVIGRIEEDALLLDLRTVRQAEEARLLAALHQVGPPK